MVVEQRPKAAMKGSSSERYSSSYVMKRSGVVDLGSSVCTYWTGERPTGVIVVSSQPQSTTRPVIRPQAARERRLDEVKATDGV